MRRVMWDVTSSGAKSYMIRLNHDACHPERSDGAVACTADSSRARNDRCPTVMPEAISPGEIALADSAALPGRTVADRILADPSLVYLFGRELVPEITG